MFAHTDPRLLLDSAHDQYQLRQQEVAYLGRLVLATLDELQLRRGESRALGEQYLAELQQYERLVMDSGQVAMDLETRLLQLREAIARTELELRSTQDKAAQVQALYRELVSRGPSVATVKSQIPDNETEPMDQAPSNTQPNSHLASIAGMEQESKQLRKQLVAKNAELIQLDLCRQDLLDRIKTESNRSLSATRGSGKLEDGLQILLQENAQLAQELETLQRRHNSLPMRKRRYSDSHPQQQTLQVPIQFSRQKQATLTPRKSLEDTSMDRSFTESQQIPSDPLLKPSRPSLEMATFDTEPSWILNSRLSLQSNSLPEVCAFEAISPILKTKQQQVPCPVCSPASSARPCLLAAIFGWLSRLAVSGRVALRLRIDRACRI